MKFFTTLAAFAVGAMAAPTAPVPCPCADKSGIKVPSTNLPGSCSGGSPVTLPDISVPTHGDAGIVASADIDAQALLKVLVDLQVDLKVLLDCVPTLDGLVLDADVLVAADLQVILDLVVRVKALIVEVQVCLEALVVLKAEILAVIGVELHACLGLIVSVVGPIVHAVLALVADLHVSVELTVIVGKITSCANELTNTCDGLTGLLAPVFKLLHL
ncbi:hypothetical protein C8A00DRAFT_45816 [Chaetomidium leptoderma]|uniref:Uncharacterized protein n=1 Tax=Chaetomidium leptoderma TaxID=669021 RepID=A0AAN6ZT25_9PEZI|nr:hypothetical protein C8A00DRAFT_45816 [Chaetomidium leptoderma]